MSFAVWAMPDVAPVTMARLALEVDPVDDFSAAGRASRTGAGLRAGAPFCSCYFVAFDISILATRIVSPVRSPVRLTV